MRRMNKQIVNWLDAIDTSRCWVCEKPFNPFLLPRTMEVHHIEYRSHAPESRIHAPCNLFLACLECHTPKVHGTMGGLVGKHKQLAFKKQFDRAHYDLTAWLKIKPRDADSITEGDVDGWVHIHETEF